VKSAILMALVLGLAGCASGLNATRPAALPGDVQANPDSYVVVAGAMSLAGGERAGSTPRGYDGAASYSTSSAALALIESIAHDYGLHEVAGWPIDALHVHCVVFRRPLEGDRADSWNGWLMTARRARAAAEYLPDSHRRIQRSVREVADEPRCTGHSGGAPLVDGAGVRIAVIDTGVNSVIRTCAAASSSAAISSTATWRVRRRPAWNAGRRHHRGRGEQWRGHRRYRAASRHPRAQGLLAQSGIRRRGLQFVYAGQALVAAVDSRATSST